MKTNTPSWQTLRQNLTITLLAYLLMGFFTLLALKVSPPDYPLSSAIKNFSFTDVYYELLNENAARKDTSNLVTIVDMTHIYRRGELAKVMDDIMRCNPKVLGVDIMFDERKDDYAGNDSLVMVACQYENIVFATKLLDYKDLETGFSREVHSFFSADVDIQEGFANVNRAGRYDNTKRIHPLRLRSCGTEKPSLVAQVVSNYTGRDLWSQGSPTLSINFSPLAFRVLQPEDVLSHPELIDGHIVLLGAMEEDADMHWTPIGRMSGIKLQAYAAQTVIDKKESKTLPFLPQVLLSILITLLIYTMQKRFKGKTQKSNNLIVRHLIGSSFVLNMCTFMFYIFMLGVALFILVYTRISINIGMPLASLAFMSTASDIYQTINNYIQAKRGKN